MGRIRSLQALMAFSLVFNVFTDFTLTVKAAIDSQPISSQAESITESLISGIEAVSEINLGENDLLTEVELDDASDITNSEDIALDDLGQVNGDQEFVAEDLDSLESVESADEDFTSLEGNNEVLNTSEDQEPISTLVDEIEEVESDISLLNDEIVSFSSTKTGLVQLWQVVPDGQTQEGKTTSQIMAQLQCKPNHNLYPLNGASTQSTYVNSCYVDDALYLGEDNNYYYIYLSGYEGKVPKSESHYFELDLDGDGKNVTYEIQTVAYFIPDAQTNTRAFFNEEEYTEPQDAPYLNYETDYLEKYSDNSIYTTRATTTVQSPSYYANEDGNLVHYITNNVTKSNNYSKVIVGKAPGWMKTNVKYYSYDGVYYYNRWQDIKVNGNGAVNASNPFYNYYQYLPFRSTTNYTANSFDSYTRNNGGAGGSLVNTGQYFISAQSQFGTNAALQYAMGIHESGWGLSSLSLNKNNLFGMNATDSNPYGNGTSFSSVSAGIYYHAERYISWGYTDPVSDSRYFGAHVGNKGSGMNVKYASDPFWGEKIAGWYYRFDSASGLKDYNYYTIGIKQSNTVVDVKSQASSSSTTLYQTKNKYSNLTFGNYPVLIIGEKNGYYQIQTDTPIVNGVASYSATYNWDTSIGYISKDAIDVVLSDAYLKNELVNRLSTFEMNGTQIMYEGYAYISGIEVPNQSNIQQKILVKDSSGKSVVSIMLDNYYSTSVSKASAHGNNKYNYDWAKVKGSFTLPALSDGEYTLIMRVNAKGITEEVPLVLHSSIGTVSYKNNNKLYEFTPTTSGVKLKVSTLSPQDNPHINRLSYIRNENGMLYLDGYSYIQYVNIPSESDVIQKIKFVDTQTLQQVLTFELPIFYSTAATKAPNHGNNEYNYDWAKYRGTVDISSLPVGEYYIKIYTNAKGHQFDTIATIHSGVENFEIKANGKTISFVRETYEGISTFKVTVKNN